MRTFTRVVPPKLATLPARFPTLAQDGIAVEYFPNYINRTYRPHAAPVVLLS